MHHRPWVDAVGPTHKAAKALAGLHHAIRTAL